MILAVVLAAAVLACLGPLLLKRLPEPHEPDADKTLYRDLAIKRGLTAGLAIVAAITAGTVAWSADPGRAGLAPLWVFLAFLGVVLSYIDWHTKLLPFLIVAPSYPVVAALLAFAAWADDDWSSLLSAAAGGVIVFVFYFAGWFFFRGGIGYGDVRLSGLIGAVLGYLGAQATFVGVWSGFAIGAVGGIGLLILKRFDRRGALALIERSSFPFGPAMFLGLWTALLLYA